MDERIHAAHIAAGRMYGREATCGNKYNHGSEEKAASAAAALMRSGKARHTVEAYPCAWCDGWHIGRRMTMDEMAAFLRV